eukprot:TRINITY_DN6910_c0_g1_i7.p1 TRINITY_DN6910_c0_g1~~TRINITY_DN6910_c0_g1_i7.p1  ORF type:complete len:688 (+),score=140.99 TRINITY_DN6910_c0_g1_i7:359-2422(+)
MENAMKQLKPRELDIMYPDYLLPHLCEKRLKFEDLVYQEERDIGSISRVHTGVMRDQPVAIRQLMFSESCTPEKVIHFHDFKYEVTLHSRLNHPNLVNLIGFVSKPPNFCLVTEIGGGQLTQTLFNLDKKITYHLILRIALDVGKGLDYLHRLSVIHLDVNSSNVLLVSTDVTSGVTAKLGNFTTAREYRGHQLTETPFLNLLYSSPEILTHSPFDFTVDIYSFGVLIWELTHRIPYFSEFMLVSEITSKILAQERPPVASWLPSELSNIVTRSWVHNPKMRLPLDSTNDVLGTLLKEIGTSSSTYQFNFDSYVDTIKSYQDGQTMLGNSRLKVEKSNYYNFQNTHLRLKYRKYLTKSNRRVLLLGVYDLFSLWERLDSLGSGAFKEAILATPISSFAVKYFTLSELNLFNQTLSNLKQKAHSITNSGVQNVDWDHVFIVLFKEWVSFCDGLEMAQMDSCKIFRYFDADLNLYNSFTNYVQENTQVPLLKLYSRLLWVSTYPNSHEHRTEKVNYLLEFFNKFEICNFINYGDNQTQDLVKIFRASPSHINSHIFALHLEHVLLNVYQEWENEMDSPSNFYTLNLEISSEDTGLGNSIKTRRPALPHRTYLTSDMRSKTVPAEPRSGDTRDSDTEVDSVGIVDGAGGTAVVGGGGSGNEEKVDKKKAKPGSGKGSVGLKFMKKKKAEK